MKRTLFGRILALVLTLCLIGTMLPALSKVEAEAVSGVNSLTCAGFISNSIAQKYIDTMMRYYINSNSNLQTTLNNGLSVVFMFEGGSDNYWNGTTYGGAYTTRNQAVCIVVKMNSSGNAYIAYYCENCSSIPDQPTQCTYGVGYSGSTTLMDGTYSFYTWNHTGPYGAFQINVGQGYYTPSSYLNGQILGASGINIHTRSTNLAYSGGGVWSAGCQVIGSGAYTSNEFNQFMKVVAGISYNVWLDYPNKSFNTIGTGVTKGYYVVDRQLGKMSPSGTQFGSGSLIQLYNSTALNNITAASTSARNAAGFSLDYKDQCEFYPSYCQIKCTLEGAPINSQPCSISTANNSENLETATMGQTFTATGIYKNLYGNYWYRVTTSSGKTGYIYGGEVEYIDDIISDVTLTGATPPNGHVQGQAFYVNGTIKSTYNKLSNVGCYLYEGMGTGGTLIDSGTDTPTSNTYVLKGSTVDNGTNMSAPELGMNTYVITATYLNYYTTDATTLKSNSGTLTLMEEYFMVVTSAVDQSSCSHTNTTYVMEESSCVSNGLSIVACTTCGKITEQVTTGGHAYGAWSTTKQPNCTDVGIQQRTCANCGDVQSQQIPANGHSYSSKSYDATCQEYARVEYSCGICGDQYSVFADELMSQWSETIPEGIDPELMETKTQYRYSDYETLTSNQPTMDGYTQLSKTWVSAGSGKVQYVSTWDSGFDTSHTLYSTYNKQRMTASETATAKTTVSTLDQLIGYIYYHWCRNSYTGGPINRTTSKTQDSTHTTFHGFYASKSTMDPSTLTAASDGSVTYANADCCTDSHWYYYIPVYEQSYSKYTASFTYARWTDFTEWSDTVVTASDTRKVEERVLYRYADAKFADHTWVDGVCSVCGTVCQHTYSNGVCTVCGVAEPIKDFYLFGIINGKSYGCDNDHANIGEYKFVDGRLTVHFTQDSYVAVKTADNAQWFVTDGWQGYDAKSTVLVDSSTIDTDEYFYIPGGRSVDLELVNNDDGTLTLSILASDAELSGITLVPTYPTLSLMGEIIINIYFELDDLEGLTTNDFGLITFDQSMPDGDVSNATDIIPGVEFDGTSYMASTHGIPAKQLGDTVYFKLYAAMKDGSYVYSSMYSYSPVKYAKRQLASSDVESHPLMVAMLNYGAEAQKVFGYKTDKLMNASLTAEQQALIQPYSKDMVAAVPAADSSKVGAFVANGGYSAMTPSVSFDGAFAINYYFTASYPVDAKVTMYYWSVEDYQNNSTLTAQNATAKLTMTPTSESGKYVASVDGIVAQEINDAVYVAGVYESDGISYCTGVLAYSFGKYCRRMAANPESEECDLAAATVVYSYYAREYFADAT